LEVFKNHSQPTFANKAIDYFTNLKSSTKLPSGIQILNPYKKTDVKNTVREFFEKYYNDERTRVYILGINPGRFGGGLTGISFTDPVALRNHCGIENQLGDKEELSSKFIYQVIAQFGGVKKFFSKFFLSAIYPLALIRDEKNYNYYDDNKLFHSLEPRFKESLVAQAGFGANCKTVICLGKKNASCLKILNDELKLFDKIEILDHPRFIMQYRKKKMGQYIKQYVSVFHRVLSL
jgi:hypothetical protein